MTSASYRYSSSRILAFCISFWMAFFLAGIYAGPVSAQKTKPASAPLNLDEILRRVEKRYAVAGYSARFFQASTLKAMDIKDTAKGRIYIKRPGKMRWEYETPEKQIIISDGIQLWIFRPEDDQVMIGKAPEFFGDGKGASFLSDIKKMRKNFEISLEESPETDNHILKLIPLRTDLDLSEVYLSVSWKTFDIEAITTYNAYRDETRITLGDVVFDEKMSDELFKFTVPEGVEIIQMGQ